MVDEQAGRRTGECYDRPLWTLPRLWEVLPAMVAHVRRTLPTLRDEPISGLLRERIMLAVAAENRCWYCQRTHGIISGLMGMPHNEVARLMAGDYRDLPEGEALALDFVRDLARRGFLSRDEQLYERLGEHFDERQRAAIVSVAHVMNFSNRFGNTFDGALARAAGRCEASGAPARDLATVSAIFLPALLAGAPVVTTLGLILWARRLLTRLATAGELAGVWRKPVPPGAN